MKSLKNYFTLDFETTTDPDDCRVWAWGVCSIDDPNYFEYGNTLEGFFQYASKMDGAKFYIHNLKFDGEFIFVHLFENGYKHVVPPKRERGKKSDYAAEPQTFNTLISDKGQFYSAEINFPRKRKNFNTIKLFDSLKIINLKIEEIAKAFGLPLSKLKLNYKDYREPGHTLTEHEIAYLRADVEIAARALRLMFTQGLTKMTQASNALHDYKNIIGQDRFDRCFPIPQDDKNIRRAYKGGFTYLQKEYAGIDLGEGLVFDVNSLYPSVMVQCPLPYGEGVYFRGEFVQDDPFYTLYVQQFTCQFRLKEGYIPTLQIKNNWRFQATQYLESSADENGVLQEVELVMTSVDLALFREHYHIYNPVYIDGWKFKATTKLFTDYVGKWIKVKNNATIEGNKGMRSISKIMLNSLYGKFGVSPHVRSKIPYYNDGKISYTLGEPETRDPLYIPVAAFITAWARDKTIRNAQRLKQYFRYADTDSLHLELQLTDELRNMSQKQLEQLTTQDLQRMGIPLPDDFEVDPVKLGAWKLESRFTRSRFLRQKCYIEDSNPPLTWDKPEYSSKANAEFYELTGIDPETEKTMHAGLYDQDEMKITCAGMSAGCYPHVTWENFRIGAEYSGKLTPKHVRGGIVLMDTTFTIKPG